MNNDQVIDKAGRCWWIEGNQLNIKIEIGPWGSSAGVARGSVAMNINVAMEASDALPNPAALLAAIKKALAELT